MKKTDLILRICAILVVALGFVALYFQLAKQANTKGQTVDQELFTALHGHGSMNVVLVVIGIILSGLFITLFRLDRKVSKLEEEIKERKS